MQDNQNNVDPDAVTTSKSNQNRKDDAEVISDRQFLRKAVKGLTAKEIEDYVACAPALHQNQYRQTLTSKKSKAKAVRMKCLECSGWYMDEVARCRVYECPLWLIRPYQSRVKDK
ncbi:MAG: hypothetical protein GY845_25675 [Planctomycetes bacterium]|nr:hypothetical protein [Planctomycetota bacterium]